MAKTKHSFIDDNPYLAYAGKDECSVTKTAVFYCNGEAVTTDADIDEISANPAQYKYELFLETRDSSIHSITQSAAFAIVNDEPVCMIYFPNLIDSSILIDTIGYYSGEWTYAQAEVAIES